MSFHNIYLPKFIEPFIIGKPEFFTSIAASYSGREIRSSDSFSSLLKYCIEGARLSAEEFERFNCFFRARGGQRFAFLLHDKTDFKAVKSLIAIGDGKNNEFQLYKVYHDAFAPYKRKITRPNTLTAYIEGCEIKAEVDFTKGLVKLDQVPRQGAEIIADFEFDVPVRFNSDSFAYTYKSDGSIGLTDIELIEVLE